MSRSRLTLARRSNVMNAPVMFPVAKDKRVNCLSVQANVWSIEISSIVVRKQKRHRSAYISPCATKGTIVRRCCTHDCGTEDGLRTYEGRNPTYFCTTDMCNGASADSTLDGAVIDRSATPSSVLRSTVSDGRIAMRTDRSCTLFRSFSSEIELVVQLLRVHG